MQAPVQRRRCLVSGQNTKVMIPGHPGLSQMSSDKLITMCLKVVFR